MVKAIFIVAGVGVTFIAALVGVALYVFDYKANPKRVKQ